MKRILLTIIYIFAFINLSLAENTVVVGASENVRYTKTISKGIDCGNLDVSLEVLGQKAQERVLEVILVVDKSGSMGKSKIGQGTVWSYEVQAAVSFATEVLKDNQYKSEGMKNKVGIVLFNHTVASNDVLPLTTNLQNIANFFKNSKPQGSTNIVNGIEEGFNQLSKSNRPGCNIERAIVVFSDGVPLIAKESRNEPYNSNLSVYPNEEYNEVNANGFGMVDPPFEQMTPPEQDRYLSGCMKATIKYARNEARKVVVQGQESPVSFFSVAYLEFLAFKRGSTEVNFRGNFLYMMEKMQNSGCWYTNDGQNLGGIYKSIYDAIKVSGVAGNGTDFFSEIIKPPYQVVPGSIKASSNKNNEIKVRLTDGDIYMEAPKIKKGELLKLDYSVKIAENTCGNISGENLKTNSVYKAGKVDCNEEIQKIILAGDLCVPCFEITPELKIEQVDCSRTIKYEAKLGAIKDCGKNAIAKYSLVFYSQNGIILKDIPEQTYDSSAGNPSGTFELPSSVAIKGSVKGVLTTKVENEDICNGPIRQETTLPTGDGLKLVVNNPAETCRDVDLTNPEIVAGSDTGGIYSYFYDENLTNPIADPKHVGTGTYWISLKKGAGGEGCESKKPVTVTSNKPDAPTIVLLPTNCGDTTAKIKINNYQSKYTYVVTPSAGEVQPDGTFTVAAFGSYTVRLIDPTTNCESDESNTVIFEYKETPPAPKVKTLIKASCSNLQYTFNIENYDSKYVYEMTDESIPISFTVTPNSDGNFKLEAQSEVKQYKLKAKYQDCESEDTILQTDIAPEPPLIPKVQGVPVQPDCNNPIGSITVQAQTGVEYSLDGLFWQKENIFNNVAPGTYTLRVRNISDPNCITQSNTPVVINEVADAPPTPTATAINPNCDNPQGGRIVIATQPNVQYSIDGVNYTTQNEFPNLGVGNYKVYVKSTSADGCQAVSKQTYELKVENVDSPELETTQPSCNTTTGSIKVTTPTTGVTYSIDGINYGTSSTFSPLNSGDYTIWIKSTEGCVATATTTILEAPNKPQEPKAYLIHPDCTHSKGMIIVIKQDSNVEYSINGSDWSVVNKFENLTPGTYTVYVRNIADKDCISQNDFVIKPAEGSVEKPIVEVRNPECNETVGRITVTKPATGVEYSLDGTAWQSSNVFDNLTSGDYTVYVKNSEGCTATNTATIASAPNTPNPPTGTPIQPDCEFAYGTITIDPISTVDKYRIDGSAWQDSNVFKGLTPGDYYLYVRNNAGCESKSENPIKINEAPITPNLPEIKEIIHPKCNETTGAIIMHKQAGLDLLYSLDGINWQPSNEFYNLAPGSYSLYVKGATGVECKAVRKNVAFVKVPDEAPELPTLKEIKQPTCTETAYIIIEQQDGVEYSIDGINWQESNEFRNLVPGNYSLYLRNVSDKDCIVSSTENYTIKAVDGAPAIPLATSINPDCTKKTGQITITEPTTGVQYSIDGTNWQDSNVFENVTSGQYNVFVKSKDGDCITPAKTPILIKNPPITPATPEIEKLIQPSCNNPYGTIILKQQQGVYYSLDGTNWRSDYIFPLLAAGKYTIYVKSISTDADVEECMVAGTEVTIVDAPGVPSKPTGVVTQPTCDNPVGKIVISPKTNELLYSVDGVNWQEDNTFENLSPKTYKAYVKYKEGDDCINYSSDSYEIKKANEAPELPILEKSLPPNCENPKGFIVIKPQTGVKYSIDGENWQAFNIFTVDSGEYYLYVKSVSGNGCESISKEKVIIDPAPVVPNLPSIASVEQPDCNVSTGKITVEAQANVEYSLDGENWQDSNVFDKLPPQKYTVLMRSKGSLCEVESNETVEIIAAPGAPELPKVEQVQHPSCDPTSTGAIIVKGQEDVEYRLGDGAWQPVNVFTGVAPGKYLIYVRSTEGNGCESVLKEPVVIKENPLKPLIPTAEVYNPDCDRQLGIVIVKSQKNAEYKITGFPWQTDTVFKGVEPGKYLIQVRGVGNEDWDCWKTSDKEYIVEKRPAAPVPPTVSSSTPECGETSGVITITPQPNVAYSIDGNNWTSTNVFVDMKPNNYTAYVKHLETGCVAMSERFALSPGAKKPEKPTTAVLQPDCSVRTGSITIAPMEGVDYRITGAQWTKTNVFTDLEPGMTYVPYVRSVSAVGCASEGDPVEILKAPFLPKIPKVESVSELTCSDITGSFKLAYQGGVEYSINGVDWTTEHEFLDLSPGTYTVTARGVQDATCTVETSVTILPAPNAPDMPEVNIIEPSCENPTGRLEFTKIEGLEYTIDNGASWTTTHTFDGLVPDTYVVQVRDAKTHCVSSTKKYIIKPAEGAPLKPVLENIVYPDCENTLGRVVVSKQPNVAYSLDKANWQKENVFENLASGAYTIYVKNLAEEECISLSQFVIKEQPLPPALPKVSEITLPTCEEPMGAIEIEKQENVKYSLDGKTWQDNTVFSKLTSGDYTIYVRSADGCVVSTTEVVTIPPAPEAPDTPTIDVVAGDDVVDYMEREKGLVITGNATAGEKVTVEWENVKREVAVENGRWKAFFTNDELPKENKKDSEIKVTVEKNGCTNATTRLVSFVYSVVVVKGTVIANDDNMRDFPVDYVKGSSYVVDIFLNDLLDNVSVEKDAVILTTGIIKYQGKEITDSDVRINPNGFVSVSPGAKIGVYELHYTICDKFNVTHCDDAVVTIVVSKNCGQMLNIEVPEFLSVNEDGKNETWEIADLLLYSRECGEGGNKVMIFDRTGTKLYEKDNYMFDDERFRGIDVIGGNKKLPRGTYLYILEVKGLKDRKTGFIFIHREDIEEDFVDTF